MVLAAIDLNSGQEKVVSDLGPLPASVRAGLMALEFPFRGFSMHPDGRSFLTSIYRESSDIWMLEGLEPERSLWRRLFSWR